MIDINSLVRENVRALVPYSCARDDFQGTDGIFLDANENPYGTLNRYPDPYQRELKSSISRFKDIPEENIFLGNGSDEIIDLSFRIFCNPGKDKALIFSPTYGMYEVSASINDVGMIKVPLNEQFQINVGEVVPWLSNTELKLIFICSPNNPTGNSMKMNDIEYIISIFKGIILIDEAYIDFSQQPSFKTMIDKYPNLIVMQTFSKAFGMAAARIGMAFTNTAIVGYFNKMKPPYNISTINQKAALGRIVRTGLLNKQVKFIIAERERLTISLEKLSIIDKVFPSDSNFLLVRTKNADLIYAMLVERKIIVRNRNKLVPGCIRITVGTRGENNKLLQALSTINL
ncbi:MAG: histidinol-phosphate transaminase [Bacteroidales bacterium]